MKITTVLFFSLILLSSSICLAQTISKSKVPAGVHATFTKLHPEIKNEKWEKENNNYEAGYQENNTEMSLLIDTSGNVMETEKEIPFAELPDNVKQYVNSNLVGKKIRESSMVLDSKGVKKFEVEVGAKDYLFDKNGNFLFSY